MRESEKTEALLAEAQEAVVDGRWIEAKTGFVAAVECEVSGEAMGGP